MSVRRNPLRAAWRRGQTTFGLWASVPNFFTAEILASAGPEFVCFDLQHGVGDLETLPGMMATIAGSGSVPVARVATGQAWHIGKALDAGALGVIVPLIDGPQDAEAMVAACRYPPRGIRSFGPIRAARAVRSLVPRDLDREIVCLAMVETALGFEHVEEIAATEGLDGIYIGTSDLALALGLAPGDRGPEHARAVARIREACHRHGIAAGVHSGTAAAAAAHAADGFQMVTVAADASLLAAAAARELAQARGA